MTIQEFKQLCEKEDLEESLDLWEKCLEQKEKAWGYDCLAKEFGLIQTVCALKKRYYRKEDYLAEKIVGAKLLTASKRPVKTVATYYHRLANGGVQRVISQLIFLWRSMGYRVVLLTDEEPCEQDFPIPQDVKRIVIPDCAKIKEGDYQDRAKMLETIIRDYQIDTMVYHAYLGNMLFWDLCILKGNQVPVTICTHSIFSYFALEGFQRTFVKMPWIYRLCDQLLTLSRVDVEYYSSMGLNVAYMPNPVEITVPVEKLASLKEHNLLWIGRISPEKNPMAAVLITEKVLETVPDAKLFLVGEGDEDLTKEIQNTIREHKLEEHVELCGFHHNVEPFYQEASVFLGTSANEGFPCTNVESRLYGVPQVYFELPYVELLRDNRGHLSVPQKDVEAAAKAAVELLIKPELRQKMGQEARQSIEEFAAFDYKGAWKKVFDRELPKPPCSQDRLIMMETFLRHLREGIPRYGEIVRKQNERSWEQQAKEREEAVKNTRSYRLGQALLYVPGRIKRFLGGGREQK